MDTIFLALLKSSKPEKEKQEVIRRITASGKQSRPVKESIDMFEATTKTLLNGSSGFQWDAAKEVYSTWARHNETALIQHFNTNTLHYLLDENFPNGFNAVWLMQESLQNLKDHTAQYEQFCEILQMKATTFIRNHPAFDIVVPFCKLLRTFREGIPRGPMTPLFCNTIIDVVSTYTMPTTCSPFKYISDTSNIIGELLGHIWHKCNEETMWHSLRHVFNLIRYGDDGKAPSVALAAIVENFPTRQIPKILQTLLQDPSVNSGHLRMALERMISWLQWPVAKNIHLWVNGFLQQLAVEKKFSILIDVTENTIEKVFGYCTFTPIRESALAVLTVMLLGYRHSPLAFHRIADSIPSLVDSLRKEVSPESAAFLKELCLMVHCMMHLHPGFPEIYEPILESARGLSSPSLHTIESQLSERGWVSRDARLLQPASPSISMSSSYSYSLVSGRRTDKRGIANMGNTCYMNSIVQALFMCDTFRKQVLNCSAYAAEKVKAKIQRAFAFLAISERPFIEPVELLGVIPPWFEQGQQQDCSEFLKYLLDQMHEQECMTSPAKSLSLVENTYSGKVQNTYTCSKCNNKSVRTEQFYDLPLAFQRHGKGTPKLSKDSMKKESVENLLARYLEPEKLHGDNKYRCDKCGKLQDAERSMRIVESPRYLILTLLRFSYDARSQHRSKIFTDVHYPKLLQLPVHSTSTSPASSIKSGKSKSGSESSVRLSKEPYSLVSVVVHSGPSLDGGHYYTYARHHHPHNSTQQQQQQQPQDSSDRWYLFNDHRVSLSQYSSFSTMTQKFSKDTAYVLIYKKIGADLTAAAGTGDSGIAAVQQNGTDLRIDLQQLVEKDNRQYILEYEQEQRRAASRTVVSSTPWWGSGDRHDDNPPPGPGAGLGGPRLVF